jgi:prepilin-type N-terminal cleavage/methylation domain-containing protein
MSNGHSGRRAENGYSLLELLLAVSIFTVISGAVFQLLNTAQKRFQTEGQILGSFQEGRLALDQIVHNFNDSGFPARNQFNVTSPAVTSYAVSPVAWSPSYPTTSCAIGTCTSPGSFDVIFEEYNSSTGTVQWIRYELTGTTLYRGAMDKTTGDPVSTFNSSTNVMFPYATNVMNNASTSQITTINASYPGTFPGGNPVPMFTYYCDTGSTPTLCSSAGSYNTPQNIRDVEVTLIIETQQTDMQSGKLRLVTLNGRGHRVNPNQ